MLEDGQCKTRFAAVCSDRGGMHPHRWSERRAMRLLLAACVFCLLPGSAALAVSRVAVPRCRVTAYRSASLTMLADYATSRVPDRMLTSLLTKSYNVQTLLSLFDIHGSYFNQVHMSAFWTTLGKHSKRNPRQLGYLQMQLVRNATLFERVRTQTTRMIPDLGHREIGNVAHGMASAGIGSAGEWSQWLVAVSGLKNDLSMDLLIIKSLTEISAVST